LLDIFEESEDVVSEENEKTIRLLELEDKQRRLELMEELLDEK
jgi:hypothetical protein